MLESFGDGCLEGSSIESSTLKECSLTTPDRSTGIGEDCSSNGSPRLSSATTLRRGGLSNGFVLGPSSKGLVLCRRGGVPPVVVVGFGVVLGNNLLIRLVVVGSGLACTGG